MRLSWSSIGLNSTIAAAPVSRLSIPAKPISTGDAHAGQQVAQLPMLSQSWHKYADDKGICSKAALVINHPKGLNFQGHNPQHRTPSRPRAFTLFKMDAADRLRVVQGHAARQWSRVASQEEQSTAK